MNPLQLPTPEEEKEILLPKSCYFLDGKTKVDYVIVIPKLDERIRGDRVQMQINQFVSQMKDKGLLVERDVGKVRVNTCRAPPPDWRLPVLHHTGFSQDPRPPQSSPASRQHLQRPVDLSESVLQVQRENLQSLNNRTDQTQSRKRSVQEGRVRLFSPCWCNLRNILRRKTLSGKRPASITTFERSQIVLKVLNNISFLFEDDEITFETLLDKEIFLQAYAIHDGDGDWTDEGPLTDRQVPPHSLHSLPPVLFPSFCASTGRIWGTYSENNRYTWSKSTTDPNCPSTSLWSASIRKCWWYRRYSVWSVFSRV